MRLKQPVALLSLPLIAVVGAVVGIAGYINVHPSHAASCTMSVTFVDSCRPLLGVFAGQYPQVASDRVSQTNYFETRLGHAVDVIHLYHTASQTSFSTSELSLINRPNTTLLLNFRPTNVAGVPDTWAEEDGSNAAVNTAIDQMAASIKALGTKHVMLAIWHEPEYDLSVSSCGEPTKSAAIAGSEAQYVAMWHNVRARFDAAGVTNVAWVYNLASDFSSEEGCEINAMYPGDNYVDWVTWDPYGRGYHPGYDQSISGIYNLLLTNSYGTHNYKDKAWGLSEFGATTDISGGGQEMTTAQAVQFYDDAKADIINNTYPRLKLYSIFDTRNASYGDHRLGFASDTAFPADAQQTAYNAFADAILALEPTPTATPTPTPAAGNGDANADGKVNVVDLSILLGHWNTNYAPADFNHDGNINVVDLSILLGHWTGG